jgi:hypothetical protein
LALDDDGIDARLVQQLPEQEPRRACADDGNLGAGVGHGDLSLGTK